MQHKRWVASVGFMFVLGAALVGWQAWSIEQMQNRIDALQQQVAHLSGNNSPGKGAPLQPLIPPAPLGGNGLNNSPQQDRMNPQNDAFAEFERLQEEMLGHVQQLLGSGMSDRLFDDNFFGGAFGSGGAFPQQQLDLSMDENEKSYVITIDIPEQSEAEVSATVDGNLLKIEGKITVENDGSNNRAAVSSTQSQQFARSMQLPPDADPDGLTNVTKDGHVIITIPKHV